MSASTESTAHISIWNHSDSGNQDLVGSLGSAYWFALLNRPKWLVGNGVNNNSEVTGTGMGRENRALCNL